MEEYMYYIYNSIFFLLKYIPNLEMTGKAILALYIYNLTKRGNVQSILPLIEKISTHLLMFLPSFPFFPF